MDSWTLGQELVFKRNTDFYVKGTPYLDELDFKIGAEPLTALLQLQKGQIDIAGDGIPPASFLSVMNDPEQKKLVVQAPQLETSYLTIKTTAPTVPTFDLGAADATGPHTTEDVRTGPVMDTRSRERLLRIRHPHCPRSGR